MKKTLIIGLISLFAFTAKAQMGKFETLYMYNFTKMIEWPANKKSGSFIIGIVGKGDVNKYAKTMLNGKMVGSQKIVVKEFSSVSAASGCHILFLTSSKLSEFSSALSKAKSMNALLITDKSGYGKKGAAINFLMVGSKLNFEINNTTINASKLKASSKLAQLGKKVG
jgi:hypothetical protein